MFYTRVYTCSIELKLDDCCSLITKYLTSIVPVQVATYMCTCVVDPQNSKHSNRTNKKHLHRLHIVYSEAYVMYIY